MRGDTSQIREMLDTDVSTWRCISYELSGHGSKQTPARFRITPYYAFLEGSSPYTISFYQKAKTGKDQLPEQAMGFFEKDIRDRVYELIVKQRAENSADAAHQY